MGLLSLARELRPSADRPRMAERSAPTARSPLDRESLQTHGVPATGGRRASAAVRGAHAAFGVQAALSERAAVPCHRRDADRRRAICGFGILVPKLPWAAVAGVWIYSLVWMVVIDMAKLLYYRAVARPRSACAAGSQPPLGRADGVTLWRSTMDFRKKFLRRSRARKFKLTDIDPGLSRQHGRRTDAKQDLDHYQGTS